jgi:S1-C subfamily serine protease
VAKRRARIPRSALSAVAGAALLLSGCSVQATTTPTPRSRAGPEAQSAPEARPAPEVTIESSDVPPPHSRVSEVVEEALPSVVNVRVTAITQDAFGLRQGRGSGSGVVIDPSGIIVTNSHVVENATKVTVVFNDGVHDKLNGTVVDTVPEQDLAIVRVDADDLDPIEIGVSRKLKPGDGVVALGYPLGLGGFTVTRGIVSAKSRTIRVPSSQGGSRTLQGLLQTDAAINPGNSGGALIDLNGRLVGINSAAAQAGAAENIGFAIAIDSALPVINQILTQPRRQQAWLGVFLDTVNSAGAALQLGVPLGTRGAVVVDVVPGSPADEAGFRDGEVIVAADGGAVTSADDLIQQLIDRDPGEEVTFELVGPGGRRTETVTLVPRPASFARE